MKNSILIFIFMAFGLTSCASTNFTGTSSSVRYNEPFIFVEQGVEFAVYPDGQFDFYYNPNNPYRNRIIAPGRIMTYNSAYNYGPYLQFDDYGAVIQIETVPIYYDFYGRIIRAGSVPIAYNNFGRISRIGNLLVHYNPNGQITATNGFINTYNSHYVQQPWHDYYRRPYSRNVIVYHQPYRAYYSPHRIPFVRYKNNYRKYRKSYRDFYRPSDHVNSYHHGRRSERMRDLSQINDDYESRKNEDAGPTRSNKSSDRDRSSYQTRDDNRNSRNTSARGRNSNRTRPQADDATNEVKRPVRRSTRGRSDARTQRRTNETNAAPPRTSRSSRERD